MLILYAKFTSKTGSLRHINEFGELLLGRWIWLGLLATTESFPIDDLGLGLIELERSFCRLRSLTGIDLILIGWVEPRQT